MPNGIIYRNVWPDCPVDIQILAKQFWLKHNLVSPGAELETRKRQLCVIAEQDGALVGISTIFLEPFIAPNCRFGFFRCATDPAYRRQGIALNLLLQCQTVLASWSRTHQEERVKGIATVIESPQLTAVTNSQPIWQRTGMILIGVNDAGHHIRIKWFDHAVL